MATQIDTVNYEKAAGGTVFVQKKTNKTLNTYQWRDGAAQSQVAFTPDMAAPTVVNTSTYTYDIIGGQAQLKSVGIADGRPRTITFVNDFLGQGIKRDEADQLAGGDPHEIWYRFGGRQQGYVGNNGTMDTTYCSALLILAATAIVLPLLPNRGVDPWGAINPRELWLLTTLVAGASFAGYVAVRVLGPGRGLLAGAAAGALVSSTVVTAELGRRVRAGEATAPKAAAGAALAAAVSVTRVTLFVAAAATAALPQAAPGLAVAILVLVAGAWALNRGVGEGGAAQASKTLRNPLELKSVAAFALLLGGVTIIGRLVANAYGQSAFLLFAAAAGATDVDTVALASGSLVRHGLDPEVAAHAILIAVLVNTFSKGAIGAATGGWRFGGLYLAAATTAALAGGLVWWFAARGLIPWFSLGGSLGQGWFG